MLNNKSPLDLKKELLSLVEMLQSQHELATMYPEGTLAPGVGDVNTYASYDEAKKTVVLSTEVQGTAYEGRSDRIENILKDDVVKVERNPSKEYDLNALEVKNSRGESLGNLGSDVAAVLSPLIDREIATIENAKVSYVEPLSKRSKKAKKAILYIELTVRMSEIELDISKGCVVCLLGGDQIRTWAQKLTVYKCDIPMEEAILLFELYNRYHGEYEENNNSLGYLGLDNLAEEVICAREKMRENRIEGYDYDRKEEADSFEKYVLKMAEAEPERYGKIADYIDLEIEEDDFENELSKIFADHALDSQEYYWLDQTRVNSAEWNKETFDGFNHWYEVIELYSPDQLLPFDLKDEDVVSIFGFEKFAAFADLSYGC